MANNEHGYGAPSTFVDTPPGYAADAFDYGYGDPSTLDPAFVHLPDAEDYGYGSVLIVLALQTVPFGAGAHKFRNNGGQIVEVAADWPVEGPFRVWLVDALSAQHECYGVRAGAGEDAWKCFTDADLERLRFAAPPLPVGEYDLLVTWNNGTQQATLEGAAVVVVRGLHRATHSFRALFPPGPYRATGPTRTDAEPLVVP